MPQVFEVRTFRDKEGREVREFSEMQPKEPSSDWVREVGYVGAVVIMSPSGPNLPPTGKQFQFDLPKSTSGLDEVFAIFDDTFKAEFARRQKAEQQRILDERNKIIVPG